jgi:hypothetical protein
MPPRELGGISFFENNKMHTAFLSHGFVRGVADGLFI